MPHKQENVQYKDEIVSYNAYTWSHPQFAMKLISHLSLLTRCYIIKNIDMTLFNKNKTPIEGSHLLYCFASVGFDSDSLLACWM